jgi:histidine ammonia-lyase
MHAGASRGLDAPVIMPAMADSPVLLDGGALTIADVERVARGGAGVEIGPEARRLLAASRASLESAVAAGETVYGVNTGFGSLSNKRIDGDQLREVQTNLLRSHAAGVGEALAEDVVRAMLLLLAGSLCRGMSGVRPAVAEAVVGLLNTGVTPIVPSVGSVGASGDLSPLAHAALVLIGEGEAVVGGRKMPGGEALAAAGLEPIQLEAKEGLALINGTHLMAGIGALALADVDRLFSAALSAAAMSIDACRGTDVFLDARVHEARRQGGQIEVAARLAGLIDGSEIIPSHLHNDPRVQDPYSLRCAPQVLGAAWDAIGYARGVVERELGAVTDNPLVFGAEGTRGGFASAEARRHGGTKGAETNRGREGAVSDESRQFVSAGNFHGMPLAIALDVLAIALSHIAGIAERRVYYILAASDAQNPLNPHLSPVPGLHSGLMIAQYVAAACCNELIGLANPSSVANIPTSAGMEDYNSMGATSALKVRRAIERCRQVVAIELLCAAEALEYQRPLQSGAGVERAHAAVRSVVSRRTADRPPAPDIAAIEGLIVEGRVG